MAKAAGAAPGGGDGAVIETSGDGAEANMPTLPDASATEAELEAHISEVLNLPVDKPVEAPSDTTTGKPADARTGADAGSGDASGEAGDSKTGAVGADSQGTSPIGETVPPASKSPEPTPPKAEAPVVPVPAEPLSLTVKDAAGTEFTLKPGDDIDVVLKDFEPTGTGQIMKVIGQFQELNTQAEARTKAEAAAAQTAEATKAEQANNQARLNAWDAEITSLQIGNRIGKPAVATTDPTYQQDPAVQRVDEVFKFMSATNQARIAVAKTVGTQPLLINSFEDALDKLEVQESKAAAETAKKTELEVAKAKSAAIGGGRGASGSGSAPAPYFAGSARSIDDV